jgi:hypothetical protein
LSVSVSVTLLSLVDGVSFAKRRASAGACALQGILFLLLDKIVFSQGVIQLVHLLVLKKDILEHLVYG